MFDRNQILMQSQSIYPQITGQLQSQNSGIIVKIPGRHKYGPVIKVNTVVLRHMSLDLIYLKGAQHHFLL